MRAASNKLPSMNSAGTNRAHHSTTPKIFQPRCTTQKNNGGAAEGAPFKRGANSSPRAHISQAIASQRVSSVGQALRAASAAATMIDNKMIVPVATRNAGHQRDGVL